MGCTYGPLGRIGGRLATEVESESSKEDRGDSLVLAIYLLTIQVKQADGGILLRKERDVAPLMIKPPRTVEGIKLETGGTLRRSSIGSTVRRSTKYHSIETIQVQLMEWWKKGVDLSQRIGDWAVHICREHNKVADLSAGYGGKGHCRVWEDESAIDWTKATGMCGFWDGSCNDKVCGAGITISIFRQELGGVMRYKKCGLVERSNSLDAGLGGCAMQIESLKFWLRKCGKSS